MQAYIKEKSLLRQKTNTLRLKEADNVQVLQPKADHQRNEIPFTEFRCISPYVIEKVLPDNNYLVRKIGSNKTQVLHRMPMH